jgi:nucleoside-diphosphate-sugar epimerase
MRKQSVLIFGGTGFLGRWIANYLVVNGFTVTCIGRKSPDNSTINFMNGNMFDKQKVAELIKFVDPKIVINAAWYTAIDDYRSNELNYLYRDCSIELANTCNAFKIPNLITLGSCAEYGLNQTEADDSSSILNPQDLYSESKIRVFKHISETYEHEWVWARVFQPYGMGQDSKRLIPYLIKSYTDRIEPKLKYPNNFSDWITSRDVGSAIGFILEKSILNEVNIGSGVGTTNQEISEILKFKINNEKNVNFENNDDLSGIGVVASKKSKLFTQGWAPGDLLSDGIDWMLSKL